MTYDRAAALRQLLDAEHAAQPALAIELARRYLARWPEDRPALMAYGNALTSLARYAEARAVFDRALSLAADDMGRGLTCNYLGHLARARFEVHEAEQWYRKAAALRPFDAGPRIFLGALLAKAGRLEEATAAHEEATRCPEGALEEAWLNLGLVRRARGDYVGALECFRRTLEIDPTDVEAQDALVDLEQVLFAFPAEPLESQDYL